MTSSWTSTVDVSTMDKYEKQDLRAQLSDLEEAVADEEWQAAADQCLVLLGMAKSSKGKPRMLVPTDLIASVVQLLGVALLQLEQYAKIVEYGNINSSSSSNNTNQLAKQPQWRGFDLYAKYRLKEYSQVVNKASSFSSTADGGNAELERHVVAQSLFRLNDTNKALQAYRAMWDDHISNSSSTNSNADDVDAVEDQLELLINALSVASSNVVPMVSNTNNTNDNNDDNDNDEAKQETDDPTAWIRDAAAETVASSDVAAETTIYHDLLFNFGTLAAISGDHASGLSCLKKASKACKAEATADDRDLIPITANEAWARHWKGLDVVPTDYPMVKKAATTDAHQSAIKLNQAMAMGLPQLPHIPLEQQRANNWTPLQSRLYWYNRTVIQLQAKNYDDCLQSCQSLRSTVASSKKGESASGSYVACLSPHDAAWWLSRVDVLTAHCMIQKDSQQRSSTTALLEKRLESLQQQQKEATSTAVLDHAIAHTQLHLFHIRHKAKASDAQIMDLLQSLPPSIQPKPAVVATKRAVQMRIAAHQQTQESSAFMADVLYSQGRFQEAADMYAKHLPALSSSLDMEHLQQYARYVQALARSGQHVDAAQLWDQLRPIIAEQHQDNEDDDINGDDDAIDAEELENKELPRIQNATKQLLNVNTATTTDTNRRSKESILRRRARKREQYVQQLEARGLRTKPNPERWLPKYARSNYRRRTHRGAQGGANERDAMKLDVAARKAGGYDMGAPSTAGMKVSSGNIRKGGRRR